eukprot:SAG31_NODE_229_length_19770_cov_9.887194_12_plen_378_part_00
MRKVRSLIKTIKKSPTKGSNHVHSPVKVAKSPSADRRSATSHDAAKVAESAAAALGLWAPRALDGKNVLHFACNPVVSRIAVPVVQQLLPHCHDKSHSLDAQDCMGDTPLMAAVRQGDIGTVQLLLAAGADLLRQNNFGDTALHIGSRLGHTAICMLLMEHDRKQNQGNNCRWSGQQAHLRSERLLTRVRNKLGKLPSIEQLPPVSKVDTITAQVRNAQENTAKALVKKRGHESTVEKVGDHREHRKHGDLPVQREGRSKFADVGKVQEIGEHRSAGMTLPYSPLESMGMGTTDTVGSQVVPKDTCVSTVQLLAAADDVVQGPSVNAKSTSEFRAGTRSAEFATHVWTGSGLDAAEAAVDEAFRCILTRCRVPTKHE